MIKLNFCRFPWLNVEDVEAGCLGLEKEGWFDPWTLMNVLRKGSEEAGTQFLNAKVVEFTFQELQDIVVSGVVEGTYEGIDEVVVSSYIRFLNSSKKQCYILHVLFF